MPLPTLQQLSQKASRIESSPSYVLCRQVLKQKAARDRLLTYHRQSRRDNGSRTRSAYRLRQLVRLLPISLRARRDEIASFGGEQDQFLRALDDGLVDAVVGRASAVSVSRC